MRQTLLAGVVVLGMVWLLSSRMQGFRVRPLGHGDMVLQQSPVTCGPASLAYILSKKGIAISEDEVAHRAGTTNSGTTLLGLAKAAETYGASAYGLSTSYTGLLELELPVIAVFPDHFVVVTNATPDDVTVADPLLGVVRYGKKAFARVWTGQLLVVHWRDETWHT